MATNFVKQLMGVPERESEAETLASRQVEDPLVAGGLAGILSGAVFGGPIGAAIGLATGLITQRSRQNIIDRTAADLTANDRFASNLFQQFEGAMPFVEKYGSDIDKAQFGDIVQSAARFTELAKHHDPSIRAAALSNLIAVDARLENWRQDIETRNRSVVDRDFEIRNARSKEIKAELDNLRNVTEESEIEADAAMQMLNDLGIDNPAVQSRLRQLANFTMKEAQEGGASVSIAPFGLGIGFNVGDYKFKYDDAVKLISGYRKVTTERRYGRMQQLVKEAQADGFAPNLRQGEVVIDDLNAYSTSGRRVEPAPVAAAPEPDVDPDSAGAILEDALTSPIIEPDTYREYRDSIKESLNSVNEHAQRHSWLLRQISKPDRKKRPTN